MMNTPESTGEPSCKRQENGDGSTTERPLKKARFAWQVKGKYHLKNDPPENPAPPAQTEKPGSSSQSENLGNTEQNLEILGDYLLKQDFNTLDSVIADHDKSLLKPITSVATEKLEYPRYVSSFESSSARCSSSRSDQRSMVPIAEMATRNYNEDQCIARWQARQMAKGFVDNTINRVLDSWMYTPIPTEVDNNRYLALGVAEFINNLPVDNSIENEGILMAISAHGLQNNSSSSSIDDSYNDVQTCSSSSRKEVFPSRSSSPLQSDDETKCKSKEDNNKSSIEVNDSFGDMTWSYVDDGDMNSSQMPFALFHEADSPLPLDYDNGNLQNSAIEYDDGNSIGNDLIASHFMDAAVSFAIQNKGLTSFTGTDYA